MPKRMILRVRQAVFDLVASKIGADSRGEMEVRDQSATGQCLEFYIRWMIRSDVSRIQQIEEWGCRDPWGRSRILEGARRRSTIPIVVERKRRDVLAYMIYEPRKREINLIRACVHPEYRGIGIGTALISWIKRRLHPKRKPIAVTCVPDWALDAQLFLRSLGWIATGSRIYLDGTEHYRFVWRKEWERFGFC